MEILFTFLIFFAVMATTAALGLKLYVRPSKALERVTGVVEEGDYTPEHPNVMLRRLLQKLGNVLPASPKDVKIMQRRLIRAGFRGPDALGMLYGSKVVLAVALPLVTLLLVGGSDMPSENKTIAVSLALVAGFFGPNEYVKKRASRRQKELRRGIPNALDLLVVCVESGLGLDQAILQVSKELSHAHPEVSEEFSLVNLELKAGKRRTEALRNLGDRTNVDEVKKLVAVLIQADRFGTGIAQSLRGHADYMRVQARQVAEEKAAKLGVKLVFPIFFFILPSLFVVTVGPVAVKIMRELMPMMQSF